MKAVKAKCKIKKKTDKNSLHSILIGHFRQPACLQKHVHERLSTIHPGILLGRALWGDSVSPRWFTFMSRDQFKPIRIGENLVVDYQ